MARVSKGLGDDIHLLAKKTRLDLLAKLFEKATGRDCGCDKRREQLNNLIPYK